MPASTAESGVAAQRYQKLLSERSTYLDEAHESAKLTVPALVPDTSDIHNLQDVRTLQKPWQSVGSRGVNALASKLLLALFPVSSPFVRYEVDAKVTADLEPAQEKEVRTTLQQALARRERAVMKEVDAQNLRTKVHESLRQLLVAGNVLIYLPPDGGMKVFKLNSYVCRRDTEGQILEIVAVEVLDRASLTPELRALVDAEDVVEGEEEKDRDKPAYLYTRIVRENDKFKVSQELGGQEVPGTIASHDLDSLPWLALRFTAIDGEHYGRGFVEEYRGDLLNLDELSKAITLASLNAAKIIALVNPNGQVKIRQLKKAENGEYLSGNPDDVTFLHLDKAADMRVALEMQRDLKRELALDFLLNQSFQRDAERVTAEEIRRMAQELEDNLGGVYSLLAVDLQLPLAKRVEAQLVRRGGLKPLPKDSVNANIVTGFAAIGRGHDLQRLEQFLTMLERAAVVFPQIRDYVDEGDLAKRLALGAGVDSEGLLRSDDDVKQQRQQALRQAQQQTLLEKGAQPIAGALAENVAGAVTQGGGAAPVPQPQQ